MLEVILPASAVMARSFRTIARRRLPIVSPPPPLACERMGEGQGAMSLPSPFGRGAGGEGSGSTGNMNKRFAYLVKKHCPAPAGLAPAERRIGHYRPASNHCSPFFLLFRHRPWPVAEKEGKREREKGTSLIMCSLFVACKSVMSLFHALGKDSCPWVARTLSLRLILLRARGDSRAVCASPAGTYSAKMDKGNAQGCGSRPSARPEGEGERAKCRMTNVE